MVQQVNWLEDALDDLREIGHYIASRSGHTQGERVTREIYHTADVLLMHPRAGPTIAEDDGGRHRHLLCYRYRIVYRVEPTVLVIGVIHGARLLAPAMLRRR